MKSIRNIFFILLAVSGLSSCANGGPVFTDNFDNAKSYEKTWVADTNATVEYLAEGGIENSGCVKISSPERVNCAVKHSLTGLDPQKVYRFSASMKCEDVKDGRGAVLYVLPEEAPEQPWNASEFAYDTQDWKTVYIDFVPNQEGKATVYCALGFPWGTYNGGIASGAVWYDNVKVEEVPADAMYRRESEHLIVMFDKELNPMDDAQMDTWLAKLDQTYEAYEDLLGGVPYQGRKIMLITTPGIEPGYWALAGNPILWNSHVKVTEVLERARDLDDWGFGILHEIGHDFSASNMLGEEWGRWNWNDEIFANFRMSYAVEACNGGVSQRNHIYRGSEIMDYYKIFYDETIGAGVAKNNGDALHYTFLRIKEKYGWDVYKKAFRSLYQIPNSELPELKGDYAKFLYFLSHVSEAAGEDVTKTCYTPEELKLIEESLK